MNNLQTGQASKQELLPLLLSVSLEFRTQNLFRFLLLMPTWLPTSSPRAGSAGSAPRGPRPPAPQPGTLTRCCWMLAWRSSACGLVRTRWLEPQLRRWMLPTAVQAISHLYLPPPRTCPHRWPPASDLGTKKPAFKGHSNQTITVPVATKCFNFNFSGYNVSYFQNMPGSWLSLQRYLPTWGKHVPSFLGGE